MRSKTKTAMIEPKLKSIFFLIVNFITDPTFKYKGMPVFSVEFSRKKADKNLSSFCKQQLIIF